MNLHEMSAEARGAFYDLSVSDHAQRNRCLAEMIIALQKHRENIYSENEADLRQAADEGLASPLVHRLRFQKEKMDQVCEGLRSLQQLPDPLNRTTLANEITGGLRLYRVTCPIGVVGIIFESRPDALVQIASLAIKSGNAVLLKGGREALRTNRALCNCVQEALAAAGLPSLAAQMLETREDVAAMLKEDQLIDLIIPRGSNAFVRYIMDNSRIPVLGHAEGLCHVYLDAEANPAMAVKVAVDSKVQNVSVCNAMETLLVHEALAPSVLPPLAAALN